VNLQRTSKPALARRMRSSIAWVALSSTTSALVLSFAVLTVPCV